MHNCRRMESQLIDLLFNDIEPERKRRLLSEIEDCSECLGQYQSLSDTLLIVERTTTTPLPPASYWPYYNAKLREKMRAPVLPMSADNSRRASFWKRLLTMRLPVPVPVAAMLVVGLLVSSVIALSRSNDSQANVTATAPPIETVKIVEVPVVQEKIVTRTVYVERKRARERSAPAALPIAANPIQAFEANELIIANTPQDKETGFFTRANLKGFQPPDEMKIRVIKRNQSDEK